MRVTLTKDLFLALTVVVFLAASARAECRKKGTKRVETVPLKPEEIEYWIEGVCPEEVENATWCCCEVVTLLNVTFNHTHQYCSKQSGCVTEALEQTAQCIPNRIIEIPTAEEWVSLEAIIGIGTALAVTGVVVVAAIIYLVWKDMRELLKVSKQGMDKGLAKMKNMKNTKWPSPTNKKANAKQEQRKVEQRR